MLSEGRKSGLLGFWPHLVRLVRHLVPTSQTKNNGFTWFNRFQNRSTNYWTPLLCGHGLKDWNFQLCAHLNWTKAIGFSMVHSQWTGFSKVSLRWNFTIVSISLKRKVRFRQPIFAPRLTLFSLACRKAEREVLPNFSRCSRFSDCNASSSLFWSSVWVLYYSSFFYPPVYGRLVRLNLG